MRIETQQISGDGQTHDIEGSTELAQIRRPRIHMFIRARYH